MQLVWSRDGQAVDLDQYIQDIEYVPTFAFIPKAWWFEAHVGDVILLENDKVAMVFDIYPEGVMNILKAVMANGQVIERSVNGWQD
jgi:hypothetical protein